MFYFEFELSKTTNLLFPPFLPLQKWRDQVPQGIFTRGGGPADVLALPELGQAGEQHRGRIRESKEVSIFILYFRCHSQTTEDPLFHLLRRVRTVR